jgi:hypothetical protein
MTDALLTAIATVLAPTLAAGVTGFLLVRQGRENTKREERREAAQRAHEYRLQIAAARSEWAAAFQESVVAALSHVAAWRVADIGPILGQRSVDAYDDWRLAFRKSQVATARLLIVEDDEWNRPVANALALSTEPSPTGGPQNDREAGAESENTRLNALYTAFQAFIKIVAGVGSAADLDQVSKGIDAGVTAQLPQAKAKLLEQVSSHAVLGALARRA